jgi:hypothetical protein
MDGGRLLAYQSNSEDAAVQNEFQAIKDTAEEMASGSFRDCFRMNRNRNFHRTALGYGTFCLRFMLPALS